jgi:DUF4097 and DUF4098 domain-containing protein YvlB
VPRSLAAALLVVAAATAGAQSDRATRFMDNCERNASRDNARACDTRKTTIPATKQLSVDGRTNGGITIRGWDRPEIQVLAMIQANAETDAAARDIVNQVSVSTGGGDIRAEGPDVGRRESWSVSYEIWVPRQTDLKLIANNGGISIESVTARVDAETQNGGLSLTDVQGDVRGRTVNGGITAALMGDRWVGGGLDLRTSNGGVRLDIPANYSANLETGTVNGRVNVDFPVTISGRLDGRQFNTTLGSGGATVRATTTNGGVSIRRR